MNKIFFVIVLILACNVMAFANPIPGSSNEVYNGNFDIGLDNLNGWDIVNAVSAENYYLQCSTPSSYWDAGVTQWIDESQNPLWLWDGVKKEISLDAQIKLDPGTGVKFWLEYWNNDSATNPGSLSSTPTGTILSNSFFRNFQGDNSYADWTSVSPFMVDNNNLVITDCQPRWVKLHIDFYQPGILIARVDSVNFTSKCIAIPEPSSLLAGLTGLVGMVGFVLRKRK